MSLREGLLDDEVCKGLLDEIVDAQGKIRHARDEMIRLQAQLEEVHTEITTVHFDIRDLTDQISAYDAEIAGIKDKARQDQIDGFQEQIAEIDDALRALEERIAEVLNRLECGCDFPPDANEQVALSLELVRLQDAADALARKRADLAKGAADLASGAIEPELSEEEQDAINAKIDGRGEAEDLLAEVQRFQDELRQDAADIEALKDEQLDLEEAAVELEATLQAEAQTAGCDFMHR